MKLAERLRSGETLLSAWSGVPDSLTVELLAGQGFDAVTLDMQHGGHHEDSVLRCLVPILKAGRHSLVRIPVGRFDMASRALDFGAEAVIAPMINSAEDARRFAAAMKYPPLGERSWGPTYGFPRHGPGDFASWLRDSNKRTLAIAMIETRAALDALDDILGIEGIDAIFLGPSDFSIALTNGETVDPKLESMMQTIEEVAARAAAAGKLSGIYVFDGRLAGRVAAMGYQLLAMGSEPLLFRMGADALLKEVRASFDGSRLAGVKAAT